MADLFIFTLLASVAAIYGLLPRYRQLRIGYSLGDKLSIAVLGTLSTMIIGGFVGSLLIEHSDAESLVLFNNRFASLEFTLLGLQILQLSAVLVATGIFLSVFFRSEVRIRNEDYLLSKMRQLYNKQEYATLVDLIRDKYSPLINHPDKPTPPNHVSWKNLTASIEVVEELENPDDSPDPFDFVIEKDMAETWRGKAIETMRVSWRSLRYRILVIRYQFTETAEDAHEYTESILLDRSFSNEHPLLSPPLGIRIIADEELQGFPRRRFVHLYLRTLLKTENSLLYREIEHNMQSAGVGRYKIDRDNRILYSFFSDCSRAKELDVYKPIGDTLKEILREQGEKDFDEYNTQRLTSSQISEDYVFSDPVFVGITFFDIMVSEALHQRMKWHMWLYYYDSVTELICENYEITDESEISTSWPNDYSRHLSEIMGNMVRWLDGLEQIVMNEEQNLPVNPEVENDNGGADKNQYAEFIRLESIDTNRGANIPKGTIICLFACHRHILTTDEIPNRFKRDITERILLACVNLRQHDQDSLLWRYSELMLHCLEAEINRRRTGATYYTELKSAFEGEVRNEVVVSSMNARDIIDRLDELIL